MVSAISGQIAFDQEKNRFVFVGRDRRRKYVSKRKKQKKKKKKKKWRGSRKKKPLVKKSKPVPLIVFLVMANMVIHSPVVRNRITFV